MDKATSPGRIQRQAVQRAAVLGAGTMGAQIAGFLASQGIPCDLLDLPSDGARNRLAEEGKQKLLKMRPSPIYTPDALSLIHTGNFSDDLPRLAQVDWVIEAVAENLDIKRRLWSQVAPYLHSSALVSTNTSSIPIASIAVALPEKLRPRFMGTHFFNPPRYLHILELIPTTQSDPTVVAAMRSFSEEALGKGVVVARDVPGFIGNRIGTYGLLVALRAMEEFGLAPDEVDSITGPALGRPNSATFRTIDLMGLDILVAICANMQLHALEPWEKVAFEVPPYLRRMVQQGWTGEKAGRGFYRREEVGGETQILVLQLDTFEYRARRALRSAFLAATRDVEDAGERIRKLVTSNDQSGRFAWRVLSQVLAYAAGRVGEVADDVISIDRTMRWGFGWDMGPFETWDILGVAYTVERMKSDGLAVPDWVVRLAKAGDGFYRHEAQGSLQATPHYTYVSVPESEQVVSVERLRLAGKAVIRRVGCSLYDMGDGVAFLDFHFPRQAIGWETLEEMEEAAQRVPYDFRGLVVGGHRQPNFCVGVDLQSTLVAARAGRWQEIDAGVRRLQQLLLQLKRLPVPLVVAPYGSTLSEGGELTLVAHRITAAAETYLGLVQVGAGLVPAGGGCKEVLLRALEGVPIGLGNLSAEPAGRSAQGTPANDLAPVLRQWFEAICLARVSGSAADSRVLGFLRREDVVVPNVDHLLYVAKQTVMALDAQGYTPTVPATLPVLGPRMRAFLEEEAHRLTWGGPATEYDLKIAGKLAYILTGGDLPGGSIVAEEHYLDLEREAFLSLCSEPKTQARMEHLLRTSRPLRN